MHVKVCGITRIEDALLAADLGASAIGLVLWPDSPRAIDPIRAREIARHVPPLVSVVGVFVNQPLEQVQQLARSIPLDVVQLHGEESPAYCAQAASRLIKSVAVSPASLPQIEALSPNVLLLLDACDPVRRGGTGQTTDWKCAAVLARTRRTLLAGGLRAENVGEAVRSVRPYGVDVSSGVEERPGVKDEVRLRDFFAAVRSAT